MRAAEAIKELRNKANKSQAALAQRFLKLQRVSMGMGIFSLGSECRLSDRLHGNINYFP